MQTRPLEVSLKFSDSESKSDQGEGGPNPRHQRPLCGLAIAFPREFVGNIGGERPVAHQRCPRLARRGVALDEPRERLILLMGTASMSGPITSSI